MRFPTPDGEQFKFEELLAADVQLMGRVTYDGFAAAWPAMEDDTGEFGKRMNNMPKVVGVDHAHRPGVEEHHGHLR